MHATAWRQCLAGGLIAGGLGTHAHAQSLVHELHGEVAFHRFGTAVALADVDGDSRADLVVGAPTGGAGHGTVIAYSGVSGAELWRRGGAAPGAWFGCALAALGDVDGDGRDDVAAGAYFEPVTGLARAGRVHVLSGLDGSTLRAHAGVAPDEHLGYSVAAADVDGDGTSDVVAGAVDSASGGSYSGAVRAWSGATGAPLLDVAGEWRALLGWSVAGAGDVDLDGHEDVLAGAPYLSAAGQPGTALLISGATGATLLVVGGVSVGDGFGRSVAGLDDVDLDGVPDLAVGAPFVAGGDGLARIVSGATGDVMFEVPGNSMRQRMGTAVAAAGDLDYDGRPDVLIGAPFANLGGLRSGMVAVVSGADGSTLYELAGSSADLQLGSALTGLRDATGDGVPDVLAAAIGAATQGPSTGAVYLHSGNDEPPPSDELLTGFPPTISVAQGGVQTLELAAGAENAGRRYLMLGSASGTDPGFSVFGVDVPLNPDRYMRTALWSPRGVPLSNRCGRLDEEGRAQVLFTLPRRSVRSPWIGRTLHHAYVVLGGRRRPVFASNAVSVTFVP